MTAYIVFEALPRSAWRSTEVKISEHAWRKAARSPMARPASCEVGTHGAGGGADQGHDRAVGQRRDHRAGREGRRHRGRLRADDEHLRPAPGHEGHALRQQLGLARPDHYSTARDIATLARALIRELPGVLQVVLDARVHLEQASRSRTATACWPAIPPSTASRPATPKAPATAWSAPRKRNGMRLISVVLGSHGDQGARGCQRRAAQLRLHVLRDRASCSRPARRVLQAARLQGRRRDRWPSAAGARHQRHDAARPGGSAAKDQRHGQRAAGRAAGRSKRQVGEYVVTDGDEVVARVPLVTLPGRAEGGLLAPGWSTPSSSGSS